MSEQSKPDKVRVLYISNIEAPYRVRFFNGLARHCDLTVLYECKTSVNREREWSGTEKQKYKKKYMGGIRFRNENAFSLRIIGEVFGGYDHIIVGCLNSPSQMLAMLLMRLTGRPYILNLDGMIFDSPRGIKPRMKRFFIKGARKYLVAGEKTDRELKDTVGEGEIIPYYFSSVTADEMKAHSGERADGNGTVLVVGQYEHYKGMDVAVEAAKLDPHIRYKFVGMGKRSDEFIRNHGADVLPNVEVIPFLSKEELEREYRSCSVLLLPSRRECWGLVAVEAASFGTPVVSTWGSGAAVELLSDGYPEYLAAPGDAGDLYNKIKSCLSSEYGEYSRYLREKASSYTIENGVAAHLKACGIGVVPVNLDAVVSVIVPVYNVAGYLDRCINSIASQSYRNLEIILVDDGSADGSSETCDKRSAADSRIRVIHRSNAGPGAARNTGIRSASGKYVMFVDSDDFIEPDSIYKMTCAMEEQSLDVLRISSRRIDGGGNLLDITDRSTLKGNVRDGGEYFVEAYRRGIYEAEVWKGMYRRDFIVNNGLWFEEGIYHEDELWCPLATVKAKRINYLHEVLYNYVMREDSITHMTHKDKHAEDLIFVSKKLAEFPVSGRKLRWVWNELVAGIYYYGVNTGDYIGKRDVRHLSKTYALKYGMTPKNLFRTILFVLNYDLYRAVSRIYDDRRNRERG